MISYNGISEKVKSNFAQIPGYRTKEKLVVFDSDDWGSLRTGSRDANNYFQNHGLFIDDPYLKYDTIASEDDLANLFGVLSSFRDSAGNYPALSANTNVANPDYEKIKASGFERYFYETFTTTMERVTGGNPLKLWHEGIRNNIFKPQYHGREHLNIALWMNALKIGHKQTRIAFECNSYGLYYPDEAGNQRNYLAAFDFSNEEEIEQHREIIEDGIGIFRQTLGYKPAAFIAPQYIWHTEHERILKKQSIKYILGHRKQLIPRKETFKTEKKFHYTGERNKDDQIYIVRNCFFEPTFGARYGIDSCLSEINRAFFWQKPAVIGTHRLNYVNGMVEQNATKNLQALKILLEAILKKWPAVIFTTTDKLGARIEIAQ